MKTGIMLEEFLPKDVASRSAALAGYGYSCVDFQGLMHTDNELFQSDENEFERILVEDAYIIRSNGLEISQAHGPWRYPVMDYTPEQREERFESMSKAIRGCAYLCCRYMVVHPVMPFGTSDNNPSEVWNINTDYYGRLAEYGREFGVTVCLENMPFPAQSQASAGSALRLIRDIGAGLGFCLDTGHCLITGEEPADAVLEAKDDLKVLHVHDNDGIRDSHLAPGLGKADWKAFTESLIRTGFLGAVSLETLVRSNGMDPAEAERAERELARKALEISGE